VAQAKVGARRKNVSKKKRKDAKNWGVTRGGKTEIEGVNQTGEEARLPAKTKGTLKTNS